MTDQLRETIRTALHDEWWRSIRETIEDSPEGHVDRLTDVIMAAIGPVVAEKVNAVAARPTVLTSIDGEPLAPGSLTVESDGHLMDWRGDAQALLKPGRTVRIVAFTDHAVYFGNALLNIGTVPPIDSDEPPVSGFMGHGELHRKDLREVADLLFTSVDVTAP